MGFGGILLLALMITLIARSITTPLRALAAATEVIAKGDFDVSLPQVSGDDEVGALSSAFSTMKESLKDYIGRLTETTAAKERIESELKIAHDIQMGILPKIFPPLPDLDELDLFAVIEPAKEVGGDFYDFFQIDDIHICFIIADVSGKGVPASLFMAVARTLIKSTARKGITPDEILRRVNNELSADNENCMFATIFCGVLNLVTGELLYANGGHNPPVYIPKNGAASFFPSSGGLVVGVMEEAVYRCDRLPLVPGDRLFFYTDGVTEAMNPQDEQFSGERLLHGLSGIHETPVRETLYMILDAIHAHAGAAPQSDDITMMIVQLRKLPAGGREDNLALSERTFR